MNPTDSCSHLAIASLSDELHLCDELFVCFLERFICIKTWSLLMNAKIDFSIRKERVFPNPFRLSVKFMSFANGKLLPLGWHATTTQVNNETQEPGTHASWLSGQQHR